MARPTSVVDSSPDVEAREADSTNSSQTGGVLGWADDRLGLAKLGRSGLLRKVFPDHWSFLLGEIALYSFIVLLLTGVFLTIWFKPSMAEIEYDGSYQLLKGLPVSEAFASTLNISFDVRGGLLVRQIHHWAALLFVAAAFVHMLRVFFTGAFRKPREVNWLIGIGLMSMSLIAGFAGYSLPDDLLSGTGLRFVDGLIRSVPIIGTWAEFFVFGGEFPGSILIPRLYMVHILLVPGLLLGLVAAHLALVFYYKHTQYPGPGRSDNNVVGYPLFPVYMAKAGGFFFIVFGFLVLMGGLFQINPVWLYGPYDPAKVTAGSQPDWYMGWVEGAIRIMPNLESHWGPTTWSWAIFLPGVGLMGLLFGALAVWPFVEAWLTGDKREHHVLDRPRNAPTRTALGVAGITCYAMFWLAGGNDIIATRFHLSLNAITVFMRVAVFVAPVIAFIVTKRICLSLQRSDRERTLHGSEDGVIVRSPEGGYSEAHVALSQDEAFALTQHLQHEPLAVSSDTDDAGVAKKQQVGRVRAALSRWFLGADVQKPTVREIEHADHHGELPEVESSDDGKPQLH
ncbi:ubiquinol-cytochrome c reductase cytochrome b subunit [Tessaracoccus bendigoensis DSM 12906]|uniref:Cytochrome bc1 complex cytochrome b subunit n=1 Tax=Tessaracoccus bendigoensis DSM 12906 TaxID=1123357 RepID=A0A1M6AUC4_9ACTN|nr:cytochrome b N-terminal domain-containing protein [Tessaracoccus bendigoensis]SHI40076.1 ubiquinol-cytochrome c reductase cytochrome b subunit [Tessaracoccus bendigoensis DSM 12906]